MFPTSAEDKGILHYPLQHYSSSQLRASQHYRPLPRTRLRQTVYDYYTSSVSHHATKSSYYLAVRPPNWRLKLPSTTVSIYSPRTTATTYRSTYGDRPYILQQLRNTSTRGLPHHSTSQPEDPRVSARFNYVSPLRTNVDKSDWIMGRLSRMESDINDVKRDSRDYQCYLGNYYFNRPDSPTRSSLRGDVFVYGTSPLRKRFY
ncbi:hypothetical protein JYU34_013156 [Plutella xylostella]|uniref:Uncharacterized protein n=1 Tax=Plutella xylostella TaxID=51655 RepID=A0ABQ7QD11_PLUXY|nr:hypothetical protein JYU34_013156 [Plutella xylostella]